MDTYLKKDGFIYNIYVYRVTGQPFVSVANIDPTYFFNDMGNITLDFPKTIKDPQNTNNVFHINAISNFNGFVNLQIFNQPIYQMIFQNIKQVTIRPYLKKLEKRPYRSETLLDDSNNPITFYIPNDCDEINFEIPRNLKHTPIFKIASSHPTFGLIKNLEGQILVKKVNGETKLLPDCSNIVQGFVTGDIVLPDYINSINNNTFVDNYFLTSIKLPKTIKKLPAFSNCINLKEITIPSSVNSISDDAFYNCENLQNVIIPNGVNTINEGCFANCTNLKSITLPNSITYLSNRAFYNCCNLTQITIPQSVQQIEIGAFSGCKNLKSITLSNKITEIKPNTFHNCSNLAEINIPNSVKSICSSAFAICSNLKSVTIPNSVQIIARSAFWCCESLKSITIPDSVIEIGETAFGYCRHLTSITIGNSIKKIGESAFVECVGLKEINCSQKIANKLCKKRDFYKIPDTTKINVIPTIKKTLKK